MRKIRAAGLLAALLVAPATASEVKMFRLQSQQAFLRGQLEGMSVDALGTLRVAPRAERLAPLAEPFVLAAAAHPDGWVVGTGNAGRVLLVTRKGEVRELFATAEPEVFAVWADADGTVYAGSSPEGKLYRYRDGEAEVWFEPGETYVWQLAGTPDGALLAATGTQGKLFRISGKGKGEVIWDSDDTHVRSLAVLPGGEVLAGTAGEGRIVRLARNGQARTLHDGVQPEVVAIAPGPDGAAYAAVVASEASQVQLAAPAAAKKADQARGEGDKGDGEASGAAVVTVEEAGGGQPVGTRPPGFRGPRSEILRIEPNGAVRPLARLAEETVHALHWSGEQLWIGTGLEGKVYTLRGTDLVLANDVEERQVMALLPAGGPYPAFATTNASAFYRLTEEGGRQGTYTSPVLDAQQIARFGSFRWMGSEAPGGAVSFSFRSGISAEPDATWSSWTAPQQGREIPLAAVPSGRYFQWRMQARAGRSETPALSSAEVSYLQENLAPRISELAAMGPGEILVPYNFNPGSQAYEPAHPNRDGIFTTLTPASEGGDERLKPLWKQGYRTLRWKAEDPNQDGLRYRLWFRPEAAPEWLEMANELRDAHYSFDATALPDGVYRFRLQAVDGDPAQPQPPLADERVSEPVVVDHSVPRLGQVRREGELLVVEIEDDWNPLREASFSVGGRPWQAASARDGLIDGRRELLELPAAAGSGLVILRVMDAAFNTVTFDLTEAR